MSNLKKITKELKGRGWIWYDKLQGWWPQWEPNLGFRSMRMQISEFNIYNGKRNLQLLLCVNLWWSIIPWGLDENASSRFMLIVLGQRTISFNHFVKKETKIIPWHIQLQLLIFHTSSDFLLYLTQISLSKNLSRMIIYEVPSKPNKH